MLAVKTEEKIMERWRRTPLTLLNLESTTDIFNDQVHKFQNSFFKEYFSKAATILQKACILRTCYEICSWQNPSKSTSIEAQRNNECIDLCFQFPKYHPVRCFKPFFTTQAYVQGGEWKKLILWLIEMNIKKTPSSIGFQFLSPKLSQESCFTLCWTI